LEVIPKEGLLEKMFAQKLSPKFLGKFGESGENPSHPQKFACSYTCGPGLVEYLAKSGFGTLNWSVLFLFELVIRSGL